MNDILVMHIAAIGPVMQALVQGAASASTGLLDWRALSVGFVCSCACWACLEHVTKITWLLYERILTVASSLEDYLHGWSPRFNEACARPD